MRRRSSVSVISICRWAVLICLFAASSCDPRNNGPDCEHRGANCNKPAMSGSASSRAFAERATRGAIRMACLLLFVRSIFAALSIVGQVARGAPCGPQRGRRVQVRPSHNSYHNHASASRAACFASRAGGRSATRSTLLRLTSSVSPLIGSSRAALTPALIRSTVGAGVSQVVQRLSARQLHHRAMKSRLTLQRLLLDDFQLG